MIVSADLARLAPSEKAAMIYAEAHGDVANRLWRAALGGDMGDAGNRQASITGPRTAEPAGFDIDSLMSLLAPRGSAPSALPSAVDDSTAPASAAPCVVGAVGTGKLGGLGPNGRFGGALEAAARRTGIPAAALAAIVDAEAAKASDGSWQTYSRNPRSSAAGLGQFLTRTWQGLAETPGTWLNRQAEAQGWLAGGRVQAHARGALLALRYDPTAAINGVADYARRNLDGLKRAGVTADDTRGVARLAYLGHHLGLGDAIRFVRDGGLAGAHAKTLLDAQIGSAASSRKIAQAGNATEAHRDWMLVYLDRRVRPEDFSTAPRQSIG